MSTVFLENIDAETFSDLVADPNSTVIIPAGATEQHGPHMPLGVDAMLSRAVAEQVARSIGALVAPTFSYGYKSQPRSGGGNHRVGTTSLNGETVIKLVEDVTSAFFDQGFNNVVILNGHFENYQFIYEGLDLATRRARMHGEPHRSVLLSYWDFVSDDTLETVFPDGFLGWDIEHGGVLETSLMLNLYPDKVDMSRVIDHPPAELTPYDIFPEDPTRTPKSGCLSSAAKATATNGKILFDNISSAIAQALTSELFSGNRR